MKQEELKPCPFCGSGKVYVDAIRDNNGVLLVVCICCDSCNAKGPLEITIERAIKKWNEAKR